MSSLSPSPTRPLVISVRAIASSLFAAATLIAQPRPEDRPLPPPPPVHAEFKFDFGPGKAVAGFTSVQAEEVYSSEKGYGFDFGAKPQGVARGDDGLVMSTELPNAAPLVSFSITGPGAVVATDSADNAGHESFQAAERHAFRGRCVAFVRATAASGNLQLTASAPGLAPGRISFAAVASR